MQAKLAEGDIYEACAHLNLACTIILDELVLHFDEFENHLRELIHESKPDSSSR